MLEMQMHQDPNTTLCLGHRFRRFFAMVKIRGTLCMRSYMPVQRGTTKSSSNSFVFRTKIEKEGLPRDIPPALGAGGPEFKSRRPDQNISRVFFGLLKAPFTQNSSVEFWQTGVLNSQVVYFLRVRHMTNLEK